MATASNTQRSFTPPLKEYRFSICKVFDTDETLNSHISMEHSQKSHMPFFLSVVYS